MTQTSERRRRSRGRWLTLHRTSRPLGDAQPLDADHHGASIAGAIVSLAQALGLETVAEGIEDADQHAQLAGLGCTYGQGFLFSRPLPPAAFDDRLRLPRPIRYPLPTLAG